MENEDGSAGDFFVTSEGAKLYGDFILCAKIDITKGPAGRGNGIGFRGEGESRYLFNFTNDGRCAFYLYENGEYTPIYLKYGQTEPKVKLDAVKVGAANWVVVRAIGDQLDIWVNGTNIYFYPVLKIRNRGTIGLYVSAGNCVTYDLRIETMNPKE